MTSTQFVGIVQNQPIYLYHPETQKYVSGFDNNSTNNLSVNVYVLLDNSPNRSIFVMSDMDPPEPQENGLIDFSNSDLKIYDITEGFNNSNGYSNIVTCINDTDQLSFNYITTNAFKPSYQVYFTDAMGKGFPSPTHLCPGTSFGLMSGPNYKNFLSVYDEVEEFTYNAVFQAIPVPSTYFRRGKVPIGATTLYQCSTDNNGASYHCLSISDPKPQDWVGDCKLNQLDLFTDESCDQTCKAMDLGYMCQDGQCVVSDKPPGLSQLACLSQCGTPGPPPPKHNMGLILGLVGGGIVLVIVILTSVFVGIYFLKRKKSGVAS